MVRSRPTTTRPVRSSSTAAPEEPSDRVSGLGRTPAAQTTTEHAICSLPRNTRSAGTPSTGSVCSSPVTRAPVRTSTPRSWSCATARSDSSGGKDGRILGPASSKQMRADEGSIPRKSCLNTCFASSASAPASSTPVGPPPMTTKGEHVLAAVLDRPALGALERRQHELPDRDRVAQGLEPGRGRHPSVVAEVRRLGTAGDDDVVPADFAAAGEVDAARVEIDALDVGHEDGGVLLAAEDAADRLGDVGGREPGGGHLVEERLKRVVVGAVDERHSHRCGRQRLRCRQPAKTRAEHQHVRALAGSDHFRAHGCNLDDDCREHAPGRPGDATTRAFSRWHGRLGPRPARALRAKRGVAC